MPGPCDDAKYLNASVLLDRLAPATISPNPTAQRRTVIAQNAKPWQENLNNAKLVLRLISPLGSEFAEARLDQYLRA